jgi:hypothetical protein
VLDTDGEQWKRKEGPELSSLRWIRIGFFSTDGGRVPCTVVVIRSLSAISGKSPKATQALDIEEKAITSTLKALLNIEFWNSSCCLLLVVRRREEQFRTSFGF